MLRHLFKLFEKVEKELESSCSEGSGALVLLLTFL